MTTKPSIEDLLSTIQQLEGQLKTCRQEIEALKMYKERNQALFNNSLDGVFIMDLDGNFLDANPKALQLTGHNLTVEELRSVNIQSLVSKDQRPALLAHLEQIKKEGTQKSMGEFRLRHADGSTVEIESNATAIYRNGEIYAIQGISRNVTHRRQLENDIKKKWAALTNAPIGIYVVQNRNFVWVNKRFAEEVGYTQEELIGLDAMDLVVPEDRDVLRENMILMLKGQSRYPFEYRTTNRGNNEERWVRGEVVSTTFNGQRAVLGYYSDIDKLMTQNITDSLTGLYNRRYIFQLAEQMVENSNRYEHPLSFAIFDVDHFKEYNDSYGHIEGDKALARIGKITKRATRKVDIPGRYGGEEFCVILPNTPIDNGVRVANRLKGAIETKTKQCDLISGLTISIGIAQLKPNYTFMDLLNEADEKLYGAKTSGRNRIVY